MKIAVLLPVTSIAPLINLHCIYIWQGTLGSDVTFEDRIFDNGSELRKCVQQL